MFKNISNLYIKNEAIMMLLDVKEPFYPPITKRKKRKDIEYIGYTYKGDEKEEINNDYVTEILDSIQA